MKAGKLDRKITIQAATHTVDAYGVPAPAWSTFATMRAQLIQGSTEEFIRAGGAAPEAVAVFRIRWIAGVTTSHRILHGGATFNIKELKEIGRRRGLELRCITPIAGAP